MMDLIITMLGGEPISLRVPLGATVGSLKSLICERFQVSPGALKLSHVNGQNISLSDDSKPLTYYGLHSGSKVCVLITKPEPVEIQVFLRNEKGQTKTYNIPRNETVVDFKRKVHTREGVPVDQQRLIYEGKQMEDGRKLEDYNVQGGSTIYLTLRLRGG